MEEARLRRTLPDAELSVAQARAPKARHGRLETRTLWAVHSPALNAYVGSAGEVGQPWPGVVQVCRIQRVVRERDRRGAWQVREEVAYAITGLGPARASAAELLHRWRVHWHIENRVHWVRDVTLGEDASQVHTGQVPEVLATLRNAAIFLLRRLDPSVAAAQRELAARPEAVLQLFSKLAQAARPIQRVQAASRPPPTNQTKSQAIVK